jgi:hypothetical protein
VSRYVITISPDNDGGADAAHTTVRVDTSTGQTRITELTVRASTGGGLAPADLPPLDLELLERARTAPAPAPALAPGAPTALAPEPVDAPEPAAEAGEGPAHRQRGRRAATRTRGRRATADAAEPAERTARGRKAAGEATPRRGRKAASEAIERRARKATQTGTRAYRRMPEPDEVMAAYQAAGTITGVAEHFGVPRHTVAGWARRLRSQGYAIGRA